MPKLNILVLDDEPIVGKRLRPALEKSGYAVEVFKDSRDAVARIAEKEFDVVVTDIFMPDKDGIVTIQELRSEFPDVGIIALSGGGGFQRFDFLETARRLGASAILRKPVDWEELTEAVSELLGV